MSASTIEIDGSFGEGGGQILRTSLALSLLTGKAFHLRNIRARRPKPGLHPQHLMSVQAAAKVGAAVTRGATLRSSDLVFEPGTVTAGKYHFDIGTAGATSLVLHTLYLPLALRGGLTSRLTLVGGTHVTTSPCFHFLDTTWRAYLRIIGLPISLHMVRPGFYPRGGGIVDAEIPCCSRLAGLTVLERGPIKVTGFSAVAGLPDDIAHRQARQATRRLRDEGIDIAMREETWPGGPGTVVALIAETTPVPALFFGLGARGKRAECVADEAVDQLLSYVAAEPAAVDLHSADQILMPLALADGPSVYSVAEVSEHLPTNAAVIRLFVDREIVCEGKVGEPGMVYVR